MEERYCQSCGMPMGQGDGLYGTEADGGKSADYCKYCYDKGAFTFHGTMDRNLCAAHGAEQPGHDPGTGSGDDAPVLSPPQALEMTEKLRPGTP